MSAINPCLLALLDEAFDKKSWHGPNLRNSLRGLNAQAAAWRPAPDLHNIWEYALHAAYWKYALHAAYWKYVVRRRITGEKRGSFVLPGSNFFRRPAEATEAAWKHDIEILVTAHRDLRYAVVHLETMSPKIEHLIRGAAAHDLYHAGQIRLLRRMGA